MAGLNWRYWRYILVDDVIQFYERIGLTYALFSLISTEKKLEAGHFSASSSPWLISYRHSEPLSPSWLTSAQQSVLKGHSSGSSHPDMAAQQPAYGGLDIAGIRAIYGIPDRCHSSAYDQMDKQTRSLAKPNRTSDTHKIPKTKYAYRRLGRRRLPTKDCTCSISRNCIHKPQGELDCRSLAPNPRESAGGFKITSG
jgi:hypothetical protein